MVSNLRMIWTQVRLREEYGEDRRVEKDKATALRAALRECDKAKEQAVKQAAAAARKHKVEVAELKRELINAARHADNLKATLQVRAQPEHKCR